MIRQAFGPNLRRIRIQKGVSIEQIARASKVSADLLHGLERNDFTRWPSGLYARAFVRQYADAIGVDPESTVDEFCRWFPYGDRRIERVVREQATIVGHQLAWEEDMPGGASSNRRGGAAVAAAAPAPQSPVAALFVRLLRAFDRA